MPPGAGLCPKFLVYVLAYKNTQIIMTQNNTLYTMFHVISFLLSECRAVRKITDN